MLVAVVEKEKKNDWWECAFKFVYWVNNFEEAVCFMFTCKRLVLTIKFSTGWYIAYHNTQTSGIQVNEDVRI